MVKSSTRAKSNKPTKPYEGFPLTPHPSGRWCKKVNGKLCYYGKIADPDTALENFNRWYVDDKSGRPRRPVGADDGCTLGLLCNSFLTSKKALLDSNELSPRTFKDYHRICAFLVKQLGRDRCVDDLKPEDFRELRSKMAKQWGLARLRVEIIRVRMIVKFAYDETLIEKPLRYGQSFPLPSRKNLQKARNEAGPRMFTADEVQRILAATDVQLRAMVLLGINTGLGNSDIAMLPKNSLDLDGGWLKYPRSKTGMPRRAPLWPETVDALRLAIAARPKAADPADGKLVFLTAAGARWVHVRTEGEKIVIVDRLNKEIGKILKRLEINGRHGLGFYVLRHNFETIGGESKDQVAVDSIMGHADPSMAGQYREGISDDRLQAVVDVVHAWLFSASTANVK